MCIDIVEIWFGIANEQIRQILMELSARDSFHTMTCVITKLGTCIDIKVIWFWIPNGQISSVFDRVIYPRYDNGGVL